MDSNGQHSLNQNQQQVDDETAQPANGVVQTTHKNKWTFSVLIEIGKYEDEVPFGLHMETKLGYDHAFQILNQLVKSPKYIISDIPTEDNQYKATAIVENIEHVGFGSTSLEAMNNAAENAIMSLTRTNPTSAHAPRNYGFQRVEAEIAKPVVSSAVSKIFSDMCGQPDMGTNPLTPQQQQQADNEFFQALAQNDEKENQRHRDVYLGKILQPKNAVTILNELLKDYPQYMVTELPKVNNFGLYKAKVFAGNSEHIGIGVSAADAREDAAQNAVRHLIRNKFAERFKKDDGGDAESPFPWQQIVSFSMFKSLRNWGIDPKTGIPIKEERITIDNDDE